MYGNYKLIMLEIHTFLHVNLKVWGWKERHGEWELTNGVLTALTWLTGDCVRTNFVWGLIGHQGAQIYGHTWLWEGFPGWNWHLNLWTQESRSPPSVGGLIQPIQGLNRTKGWGRGSLSLQLCLTWDVGPLLSWVSNSLECKLPGP